MKLASIKSDGITLEIDIDERLLRALPDQQLTWLKATWAIKAQHVFQDASNDLNACLGFAYGRFLREQVRKDPLGNLEKDREER